MPIQDHLRSRFVAGHERLAAGDQKNMVNVLLRFMGTRAIQLEAHAHVIRGDLGAAFSLLSPRHQLQAVELVENWGCLPARFRRPATEEGRAAPGARQRPPS